MNAHKDTQHPAGSIRPTERELKGQQDLSDYIRSINRAQAFDDVANEQKINFEEWWREVAGTTYSNFECSESEAESIWNAALTRGKISP